jgi:archaellum biogenesis ATPase FlaH
VSNKICYLLEKILSYDINEKQKIEILDSLTKILKNDMVDSAVDDIISFRNNLINSIKSYISFFSCLFVNDMSIISKQ